MLIQMDSIELSGAYYQLSVHNWCAQPPPHLIFLCIFSFLNYSVQSNLLRNKHADCVVLSTGSEVARGQCRVREYFSPYPMSYPVTPLGLLRSAAANSLAENWAASIKLLGPGRGIRIWHELLWQVSHLPGPIHLMDGSPPAQTAPIPPHFCPLPTLFHSPFQTVLAWRLDLASVSLHGTLWEHGWLLKFYFVIFLGWWKWPVPQLSALRMVLTEKNINHNIPKRLNPSKGGGGGGKKGRKYRYFWFTSDLWFPIRS